MKLVDDGVEAMGIKNSIQSWRWFFSDVGLFLKGILIKIVYAYVPTTKWEILDIYSLLQFIFRVYYYVASCGREESLQHFI